jgi:hypothetical protein
MGKLRPREGKDLVKITKLVRGKNGYYSPNLTAAQKSSNELVVKVSGRARFWVQSPALKIEKKKFSTGGSGLLSYLLGRLRFKANPRK